MEQQLKLKIAKNFLIAILIVLAVSLVGVLFRQQKNSISLVEEAVATTSSEVVGWKTYKNNKYGFEVQYPSRYKEKEYKEEHFYYFLGDREKAKLAEFAFSYDIAEYFPVSPYFKIKVFDGSIKDYRFYDNDYIDEWAKLSFAFDVQSKKWTLTSGENFDGAPKKIDANIEAYFYKSWSQYGDSQEYVIIFSHDYSFVIELMNDGGFDDHNSKYKDYANFIPTPDMKEILSTFGFITPTAGGPLTNLPELHPCLEEGQGRKANSLSFSGSIVPCCAGLTKIKACSTSLSPYGLDISGKHICTYCGDGVCGTGELKCNCPHDCK